jgi:acetate---CoA ligase (ADP-forming)
MNVSLQRLLKPKSIALIGGVWTDAVAKACAQVGYSGTIYRVHPKRESSASITYYRSVDALPVAVDAAFVAAPADDVPEVVAQLNRNQAGGFVCFASGFDETHTAEGHRRSQALLAAAGDLPFTGPNCYGLVNFFDRVALWPDQAVGNPGERGVALITQSGTIGLTLMFQQRDLPVGYVITVGNQSRLALEDLIDALSDDPRVSAFGLYIEGIQSPERFVNACEKAKANGKPIALVKAGRTEMAAKTAATHTGALAGSDVVFDAICKDLGLARVETLSTLIETLKVFHAHGPLKGNRVLVMGASGGDMAMTADVSRHLKLEFAPLPAATHAQLRSTLDERVTLANPFDFHTYIWFDQPKLKSLFHTVMNAGYDAVAFMLDCPPVASADVSAYDMPMREFIDAAAKSTSAGAMLASLPETLYADIRHYCYQQGVMPLQGQREGLEALSHAALVGQRFLANEPLRLRLPPAPAKPTTSKVLDEPSAKAALSAYGVPLPKATTVSLSQAEAAITAIGFPVVLKAVGEHLTHKTEAGGVFLNIRSLAEAQAALAHLSTLTQTVLVEQMINDSVAEILVGLTVDPQWGQVLVIGSGGIYTEYHHDITHVLPPFSPSRIGQALESLKIYKILKGYRNRPAGDLTALISAIMAITRYAEDHLATLKELDVNPLIVRPTGVVAVDALIRLEE